MELQALDYLKATTPMPVVLVSTLHGDVKNIAPYAWHMPISMDPPLLGVAIRNIRDTFKNIEDTGEFVLCVPGTGLKKSVIKTARSLPRDKSEFDISDLTPMESKVVKPFGVKECQTNIECKLEWMKEAGDHHVVVGKVVHVQISDDLIKDGAKIEHPDPLVHIGGGRNLYAGLGDLV